MDDELRARLKKLRDRRSSTEMTGTDEQWAEAQAAINRWRALEDQLRNGEITAQEFRTATNDFLDNTDTETLQRATQITDTFIKALEREDTPDA